MVTEFNIFGGVPPIFEPRTSPSDAILGIAAGYQPRDLDIFLSSLKKTQFNGDLVLFVDSLNSKDLGKSGNCNFNIILVGINPLWHRLVTKLVRYLFSILRLSVFQHELEAALHSAVCRRYLQYHSSLPLSLGFLTQRISISRYLLYLHFLSFSSYDRIFLTDTRDVYFQESPFMLFNQPGICAFAERSGLVIRDQSHNSNWIKSAFSEAVLQDIRDEQVLCSGTILGTQKKVIEFLELFIWTVIQHRIPQTWGIDQGIFNFLVHRGTKLEFFKMENGDIVLTVGMLPEGSLHIRDSKIMLKERDSIPAVVHQYDRNKMLDAFIRNLLNVE